MNQAYPCVEEFGWEEQRQSTENFSTKTIPVDLQINWLPTMTKLWQKAHNQLNIHPLGESVNIFRGILNFLIWWELYNKFRMAVIKVKVRNLRVSNFQRMSSHRFGHGSSSLRKFIFCVAYNRHCTHLFIFWSHDMAHRISVPQPGIKPVPAAVEAQSPVRAGRPGNSHTLFWETKCLWVSASGVELSAICKPYNPHKTTSRWTEERNCWIPAPSFSS